MEDNSYKNVESIINALRPVARNIVDFRKLDGITIECKVAEPSKRDNAMNEIQAISKQLGVIPVAVELRNDSDVLFGAQYPDLVPEYTQAEVKQMYIDNFKFLFDNIKMKDPKSITKTNLIENMDRFIKHATMIYYKSNINQYKETLEDFTHTNRYKSELNGWYLDYMMSYITGNI